MQEIRFEIPGKPLGKARPRFVPGTKIVRTPTETKNWEQACGLVARMQTRGKAFDGFVALTVHAVFKRPKRMKDGPRAWRKGTPDGDNILKAVADGLEKGGVIKNDTQIVAWQVFCVYGGTGETERVCIHLRAIKDEEDPPCAV